MKDNKTFLKYIIIFILSGIFGFIYEVLFYRIDLGYFVKRGTTVGPWIPIYAFGGLFISLITNKVKDKPLLVFLIGLIISGLLEYLTGFVLLKYLNTRLWDYNTEIWNFGNINGFICLRSVLFFGLSSLILQYTIIPFINKMVMKNSKMNFIYYSLFILFVIDIIISDIICLL